MKKNNSLKNTPTVHSYPQRIAKVVFFSTFILAIAYACFLVGKYVFWFAVNYQNRNFSTVFSFIIQLAFQTLLAFSSFVAMRKRNKIALGLSIVPLVVYSILLLAPGTIIKGGFSDGMSPGDRFLYITSFCTTILLLLLTIATITISIIRIVKNKQKTIAN